MREWVGLIPAHAGKTRRGQTRPTSQAAHPRSRGENDYFEITDAARAGSSPLTRGKHVNYSFLNCPDRLIPAHAGKTYVTRTYA